MVLKSGCWANPVPATKAAISAHVVKMEWMNKDLEASIKDYLLLFELKGKRAGCKSLAGLGKLRLLLEYIDFPLCVC